LGTALKVQGFFNAFNETLLKRRLGGCFHGILHHTTIVSTIPKIAVILFNLFLKMDLLACCDQQVASKEGFLTKQGAIHKVIVVSWIC